MSSLVHCVYSSLATHPMSHADIDALISQSSRNNLRHGITGVLVHVGNCFIQVLEGAPERVDELYAKILVDPRHTRITRIVLEAIPHRFFGEWTMALSTLGSAEIAQILESPDQDLRELLFDSVDEGRAKKLLRAFSEGRWRQTLISKDGLYAV